MTRIKNELREYYLSKPGGALSRQVQIANGGGTEPHHPNKQTIRLIRSYSRNSRSLQAEFGMARKDLAVFGRTWQNLAELGRTVQFRTGANSPRYGRQRSYEK